MTETLLEYDIVIIGSGAGGGTVAKELSLLCKKGAKIALIEWGGHFEKKDNTRHEIEMAQKYYFDFGGFQTTSQDLTLAFAKAVGGSTTVYTGTSLTAPQEVFDRWSVSGLDLADMGPRYKKYILENNVHLNAENELNENNTFFRDACQKLGWSVRQFPVNTRQCIGLGTCNLGCAIHAKQGTALVQIPEAVKNGVQLIPFCHALKIEDHDVVAQVLPPEFNLKPSPLPVGNYRFRAKKIVVCGGAMNSTPLLLRSFGEQSLPALGRYFTCHPALILVGEHPRPITNITGHPKSFYCDEFHHAQRFLLESCIYYPFTLAKNLTGYGPEVDELMAHFRHLQMILVLAIDDAEAHNRVGVDAKGNPVVHYRFSEKTKNSLLHAIRASAKIFFAAGARRVHAPAAKSFFITAGESQQIDELITEKYFKLGQISIAAAHLMGGCRMGSDPKTSVTNPWGKVHGMDHLYVADSSLFPAASEVNPYLTIMALADRVAEGIRRDLAG